MINIFITVSIFLFINLLILNRILPLLEKFLPDIPNYRSLHISPIPKGGGISFVLTTLIYSILLLILNQKSFISILPIICFPLAIIGFLDDFINLKKITRYFFQLVTALLILFYSDFLNTINDFEISSKLIFLILFLIIITSIINFTNFMDGIDGLLAGSMNCAIIFIAISKNLPINYWALVGSLTAFLLYNWNPAKLFMGDVGSTYLGAIYAGLCINTNSATESIGILLIIFPLIADAFTCLLRRLFSKQNIFKAHSLHLYQRLSKAGFKHSEVSLMYISLIFINGFSYFYFDLEILIYICVAEFLLGFFLDKSKAIPFKFN